jgi:hypothetical protein
MVATAAAARLEAAVARSLSLSAHISAIASKLRIADGRRPGAPEPTAGDSSSTTESESDAAASRAGDSPAVRRLQAEEEERFDAACDAWVPHRGYDSLVRHYYGSGISTPTEKQPPPATLQRLRSRIRARSYTVGGESRSRAFRNFDRDNSGRISLAEFTSAIRRTCLVVAPIFGRDETPATLVMSDGQLRMVFEAIDKDGSGSISHSELAGFVWGISAPSTPHTEACIARRRQGRDDEAQEEVLLHPERLQQVRQKIRAASYSVGGQDVQQLFRSCCGVASTPRAPRGAATGTATDDAVLVSAEREKRLQLLSAGSFEHLLRVRAKLTHAQLPPAAASLLFQRLATAAPAGSGYVGLPVFLCFVGGAGGGAGSPRGGAAAAARGASSSSSSSAAAAAAAAARPATHQAPGAATSIEDSDARTCLEHGGGGGGGWAGDDVAGRVGFQNTLRASMVGPSVLQSAASAAAASASPTLAGRATPAFACPRCAAPASDDGEVACGSGLACTLMQSLLHDVTGGTRTSTILGRPSRPLSTVWSCCAAGFGPPPSPVAEWTRHVWCDA